jgi:lipopolysaccharide biosynthesis regulator YciM
VYGQQQTEQAQNLIENSAKYYCDLEVEMLISEITEAAREAIEQAAGEAARAALLASLEREAIALREAQWWRNETEELRNTGFKNKLFFGAICFIGGLVAGVAGTLIIGGR